MKTKFVEPMQPKAVEQLPTGPEWTYEVKWDGYRILVVKNGPQVRLLSRTGTDMTAHFRRVATSVARLPHRQLVLDGEVVALDASGHPTFRGLQDWHRHLPEAKGLALAYYVFDLLELNGRSWRRRPLAERRRQLRSVVRGDALLLSLPLPGTVAAIERRIREFGLEGVVAKRRHSLYRPGERADDWQKVRYSPRQEFVVGGYVPRDGSFDSLLVGYFTPEGKLRFAGAVREGFTAYTRAALALRLRPPRQRCPFADLPHVVPYPKKHPWDDRITADEMARLRWVSPSEVIEVSYLGWTRHDLLRQGRFVGVREDKSAREVRRE